MDTQFVRGAERLRRRLQTIQATLSVPVIVEEVGALLLRRTLKRFDSEVDPDGRSWAPLADTTLERRKRKGGKQGKKTLVQTGAMRAAIAIIKGGTGSVFTNTGAGLRIGIDDPDIVPRARTHNRGLSPIPQRRFLGIGALDVGSVDALMRRKAKKLDTL